MPYMKKAAFCIENDEVLTKLSGDPMEVLSTLEDLYDGGGIEDKDTVTFISEYPSGTTFTASGNPEIVVPQVLELFDYLQDNDESDSDEDSEDFDDDSKDDLDDEDYLDGEDDDDLDDEDLGDDDLDDLDDDDLDDDDLDSDNDDDEESDSLEEVWSELETLFGDFLEDNFDDGDLVIYKISK